MALQKSQHPFRHRPSLVGSINAAQMPKCAVKDEIIVFSGHSSRGRSIIFILLLWNKRGAEELVILSRPTKNIHYVKQSRICTICKIFLTCQRFAVQ